MIIILFIAPIVIYINKQSAIKARSQGQTLALYNEIESNESPQTRDLVFETINNKY